jgi:hypothetical protein
MIKILYTTALIFLASLAIKSKFFNKKDPLDYFLLIFAITPWICHIWGLD